MFVKVTISGGHRYARLVESFRNEDGQPRQRTVATLPRRPPKVLHLWPPKLLHPGHVDLTH